MDEVEKNNIIDKKGEEARSKNSFLRRTYVKADSSPASSGDDSTYSMLTN